MNRLFQIKTDGLAPSRQKSRLTRALRASRRECSLVRR